MTRKTTLASVIALVAAAMIAAGAVYADDGEGSRGQSSGNQLVGTWVVTVNRPAPLPPLTSLQVFTRGGSVVEMASERQDARSASYGSWERIERRLYASTMVFFRFNPQTGEYLGRQKIDRTIELARDGQSFAHVARVTIFDTNDNPLASFTARATGERMEIERIPDQP
jgi:hypothetical protein